MSKTEKLNEEQVFKQALDDDELEAVAGGKGEDDDNDECIKAYFRYKEGEGCAATVEDDSWCMLNDACSDVAVVYECDGNYH